MSSNRQEAIEHRSTSYHLVKFLISVIGVKTSIRMVLARSVEQGDARNNLGWNNQYFPFSPVSVITIPTLLGIMSIS